MAARTRKLLHDPETRAKIKGGQLIERLQNHVLGKSQLDPSQVSAGLGLLKKIIPDLAAVQHSGEGGGPMTVKVIRVFEK
jgi:hypothetical protein